MWRGVVRAESREAFCCLMTVDGFVFWAWCGIPLTWHSPTARRSGGGFRCDRRGASDSSALRRRVVAPWARSTGCHTLSSPGLVGLVK